MDQDEMWVGDALGELPGVAVTPALQARILADFDRVAARRWSLRAMFDAVWPGVPVWRPATVLAAALVIGIAAGIYVPLEDSAEQTTSSIAFDAPPSFDLGESS